MTLVTFASGSDEVVETSPTRPTWPRSCSPQALMTAAVATVDLNRRYRDKYLGDMRGRRPKELRVDVK